MSVGAVGGIGAMGAGMTGAAATGASAAGATEAGAAGASQSTATQPKAVTAQIDSNPVTSLSDIEQPMNDFDFNSIDLLIALLLMSALTGKDDDEESKGSSAMGFLAGLALAGSLTQTDFSGLNAEAPVEPVSGGGDVGGQLNVTA